MKTIPVDERFISDEEVFASFDLNRKELSAVRASLNQHDMLMAKKELIHYFETRCTPLYLYDYRNLPLSAIDTNTNPYAFQASLGLSGSLKEFCLYAGNSLMKHIYVRPGREHMEVDLGPNYENLFHFNFLEDQAKKHRSLLDIFVRGQIFEYLSVLYHETGDKNVLAQFEEILLVFFKNYPLVLEYMSPDASRFSLTEDRDVMSTGWLVLGYISLFYTRIPYEISTEVAFEIIKHIWFLSIQFRRFDTDTYRSFNHHMWERGLVPFILGTLLPEIPDIAIMKEHGASIVRHHILDDFNEHGGYSEHSIPYWSGAALGEMLYRGIETARLNDEPLLDEETRKRIDLSFRALALITPPGEYYPSVGDNGGPYVNPLLEIGSNVCGNTSCKEILAVRTGRTLSVSPDTPLDYCNDKAGFVCARSSFRTDANYMLMSAKINCGESGHNHMDMLSLFIFFRGQEFIGEPHARPLYHTGLMGSDHRGYLYNMESHNTVLAYGKAVQSNKMYADKWGVFRPDSPVSTFISSEDGIYASASHDAYTFCRHTRCVYFHREKGLLIKDEISRGNRFPDAHIQRWNLPSDVSCNQIDSNSILLEKNGVSILCLWTGSPVLRIWQKENLYPEIIKERSQLSTIIDASFLPETEKKEDMATVSLNLLMLDVTGQLSIINDTKHLLSSIAEILKETDYKEALKKFSLI